MDDKKRVSHAKQKNEYDRLFIANQIKDFYRAHASQMLCRFTNSPGVVEKENDGAFSTDYFRLQREIQRNQEARAKHNQILAEGNV